MRDNSILLRMGGFSAIFVNSGPDADHFSCFPSDRNVSIRQNVNGCGLELRNLDFGFFDFGCVFFDL